MSCRVGIRWFVKEQPRFPCLGQNSFPFALMKTEQETSSGNRAHTPLPEPFYSQKQRPGNVRKSSGSNLGSIAGTLFGSSNAPSWEPLLLPHFSPIDLPAMASKRRNIRASSPLEWVQKERTTAGNRAGNSNGNSIGNHDGTTMEPR